MDFEPDRSTTSIVEESKASTTVVKLKITEYRMAVGNDRVTRHSALLNHLRIELLKKDVLNGDNHYVHGNFAKIKNYSKTSADEGRLRNWYAEQGQHHPRTGKIVISKRLPKRIISMQAGISKIARTKYLIKKTRNLISIESSSLMNRCNVCSKIKTHIRRGKLSKSDAHKLMSVHMDGVKDERNYVNSCFAKSEVDIEYLHLTIDDMSNIATKLPHLFDSRSKLIPDSILLRADLSGAVHAKKALNGGHVTDLHVDVGNLYAGGSNATLGFLLSTLQRCTTLPSTLHLQLDGAKSNKNKVLLSLLSYFVSEQIFTKIIVHFLPSGHSHAHCDRFFAQVRKALDAEELYTPGELLNSLGSLTGVRSVRMERLSFDFKSCIEPQLRKELDGIFSSMHFSFERKDGEVVMSHRPLGSSTLNERKVKMVELDGTPLWSIDTADFETMIDCAGKDGSLPKETIEMWRKAMSRVENEPEKISWKTIMDNFRRKKSARVLPPSQLKEKDQEDLQYFLMNTKNSRKRRSPNN
ncbi:hypothetical protein PRIPAC_83270 [Pristionchus pacificus]|uniref:DUF7869 domain-containing protein n=1 Tax=Pristionchus pacificus TaxID=54126 RepID=A0A2A6BLU3_PRIPA|nr:hypothetical protein PRIPAC_83270 [Pristionchus pacificus]|eukprot:PDM66890.1 hypothetical protein PRIPAC_48307 [Pristionchus pacificus]